MNRIARIAEWQFGDDSSHTRYDLFVTALGYESRATHAASKLGRFARKKLAMGFAERKVLAYCSNRDYLMTHHFDVIEPSDSQFQSSWEEQLTEVLATCSIDELCRLCVDISSLSRFRLAIIIEGIENAHRGMIVEFVYSPAVYSAAPESDVIQVCGPVTPRFAGWAGDPRQPLALAIGLGYEPSKALGVVEYLEPKHIWLFEPFGGDPRYERAVRRANKGLLQAREPAKTIPYPVNSPLEVITLVDGLAYAQLQSGRLVLVPLGPKVLALCCLLVACLQSPRLSVWRVSSGQLETATERRAAGPIWGLSVTWC